jgi:hypothetical protein
MPGLVVRNWKVALIEAYPDLFQPPAGTPEGAEGAPECGEGWRDLLDCACIRIQAAISAQSGSFRFTQIKEKYGTARLYWEGVLSLETEEKVDEAIDLAQARSACTCEQCGKPGRLFNRGGWFATACDEHGKGVPVAERRDFEQVHVVYRIVEGHAVASARRYDRSTDTFIYIHPGSSQVDER